MGAKVTVHGLDDLEHDIDVALETGLDQFERVMGKAGSNMKRDWVARWTGHAHIPHLPRAISYDVTRVGTKIDLEVGVEPRRRQGPLAHIIEFGTPGHNAPIPGGLPALQAEEPRLADNLAKLAEKLLS